MKIRMSISSSTINMVRSVPLMDDHPSSDFTTKKHEEHEGTKE
jgi:hypothetical protein